MFSISRTVAGLALVVSTALPALAETRSFTLTPASEVRYKGYHQAHNWEGVSRALRGTLTLQDGNVLQAPMQVCLPARSFSSGNRNRDSNALSAIAADKHPDICLIVQRVDVLESQPDGTATVGRLKVSGRLRFHGVEKPLTLVMDGRLEGKKLTATGQFPVSLSEFHVKRPSLLFIPIEDRIDVTVTLDAIEQ